MINIGDEYWYRPAKNVPWARGRVVEYRKSTSGGNAQAIMQPSNGRIGKRLCVIVFCQDDQFRKASSE